MKLNLITYGKGKKFISSKFTPIENIPFFVKPKGGLWASPVNSVCGWREWCKIENFGDLSNNFTFGFDGNVFVIDSISSATSMPWIEYHNNLMNSPDFEKMLEQGYDAIYLTEKGQKETRFSTPSLYGWDCECVLIMNPKCIS